MYNEDVARTMEMVWGQAYEAIKDSAKRADYHNYQDAKLIETLVKTMHYAACAGAAEPEYSQAAGPYVPVYDAGSSYQRRDSMGRYSSTGSMGGGYGYAGRRGYSRGSLMDHIEELMGEARTDQERQALERLRKDLDR